MNQLIPCTHCQRHVRQSETSCPFCGGALELADIAPAALPRTRLGRAATFAFGATIVGATSLVGCSGDTTDGKQGGAGMSSGGSQALYGGPPGGTSSGGASGGNTSAGSNVGGSIAPLYGFPAGGMTDNGGSTSAGSGGKVNDGGGAQALYGAVPAAGSENGAGTGGGGGFPLYGAAPAD